MGVLWKVEGRKGGGTKTREEREQRPREKIIKGRKGGQKERVRAGVKRGTRLGGKRDKWREGM